MTYKQVKPFLRIWLLLLAGFAFWTVWDSRYNRGIWFLMVGGLFGVFLLAAFLTPRLKDNAKLPPCSPEVAGRISWLLGAGGVLLVLALFNLRFYLLNYASMRGMLLVGYAGLAGIALANCRKKADPFLMTAAILLGLGAFYRVLAFGAELQSGPFALGWSEGSRFYNASTFFSKIVYGQKLPWPVLHPSRYLMQALPFLLGIKSILAHRVWQVLLWLVFCGWGAWLTAKRLAKAGRFPLIWLFLFVFLFFFQGVVYYHLMVVVILTLLGYRRDQPWWTLVFVVLASVWAGISRVNWVPVAGLFATSLWLLDEPFDGKNWLRYLSWPAIWTLAGSAVGLLSKELYIGMSGEPASYFDSAFSSALLWYRLWPNATFFLGILPGILLVCLPTAVLTWKKLKARELGKLYWLRWLGLTGILAVFFAGGLIVSVKIGGGGDLHNLDAFLVFWVVIVCSLLLDAYQPDKHSKVKTKFNFEPAWLLMAVLVPVAFTLLRGSPWQPANITAQQHELDRLKMALDMADELPGDVLFISERHLLSFDQIEKPVVSDYEKVFLMEMAMGNNQEYLQTFFDKLEKHDFSAIVIDPISTAIQGRDHGFSEENNAWVENVLVEILKYYELGLELRGGEVNILVPMGEQSLIDQLQDIP